MRRPCLQSDDIASHRNYRVRARNAHVRATRGKRQKLDYKNEALHYHRVNINI